jgi:hypothetical protein
MNDLSNVGPGLKKEFKKLAGLNSTEESLLNTINKEMTSSQKSAQELLQAGNEDFNEDWTNAILGDDIKDAENKIMDDAEKELALAKEILFGVNDTSQTIAYDPTQDVDTRTSGPDEVEDWMGEIQPRISDALDQTDILDVSQNVPITREQKIKAVNEGWGWGSLDDTAWIDQDDLLDDFYNEMREAQDKGMERLPWEGVVAYSPFKKWQQPGTSEFQDQIRWNTANRPLDWSGGETPELREDYIKENFITDDWGFNQGGYLKKYDDGGYANMSTYEKLKAINDSIAEG